MPRVIQDSDDEGDLSTVSSPTSNAAKSPGPVARSPSPRSTERSAPGTSSTELVQRNIENTHQQFIQPTTASAMHPRQTLNHPEVRVFPSPSPKRRRMMTTSELIASPARRLSRRGTVDSPYRTKPQQLEREQAEDIRNTFKDDEVDTVFGVFQKEEIVQQESGPSQGEQSTHSLLHSMKHGFAQHEPVTMFPDASSTVPNATMTQQMLFAAECDGKAAARDADGHLINSALETESSIPWSAYLESPKITTQSSRNQSIRSQAVSEANVPLTSSRGTKSTQILNDDKVELKDSQSARKRRTKTLNDGRYDQMSQDELANDSPLKATRITRAKTNGSTSPNHRNHLTSLDGHPHDSPDTHDGANSVIDELSADHMATDRESGATSFQSNHAHNNTQVTKSVEDSIRAVRLAKSAKTGKDVVSDTLNSDDIAIGLPKEKYQPRPSRSRSKRVAEEPIDFSVRPEKAAKDKAKRRCTTSIVALGRLKLSHAEKVESLENKGFSQTQARLALEAKENDLDAALQWLTASSHTKSSSLAKDAATDLAGTSSVTGSNNEKRDDETAVPSLSGEVTEIPKSTKVRVEIPSRRTTTPSSVADSTKRKRGRPSKASVETPEITKESPEAMPGRDNPIDSLAVQSHGLQGNPDPIAQAGPEAELQIGSGEYGQNNRTRPISHEPAGLETLSTLEAQPVSEEPHKTNEKEPPKKRGRGRPRRSETKGLETIPNQDSTNENNLEADHAPPNAPGANADPPTLSKGVAKANATSEGEENRSAVENKVTNAPPADVNDISTAQASRSERLQTPQRPNSEIKPATTQSPQSNGKVPYRVGLSRRARIAPLLRSVKK